MSSHGPLNGMLPNLQAYINQTGLLDFGDLDLIFKVTASCKFEEDPVKTEGTIVSTTFSQL